MSITVCEGTVINPLNPPVTGRLDRTGSRPPYSHHSPSLAFPTSIELLLCSQSFTLTNEFITHSIPPLQPLRSPLVLLVSVVDSGPDSWRLGCDYPRRLVCSVTHASSSCSTVTGDLHRRLVRRRSCSVSVVTAWSNLLQVRRIWLVRLRRNCWCIVNPAPAPWPLVFCSLLIVTPPLTASLSWSPLSLNASPSLSRELQPSELPSLSQPSSRRPHRHTSQMAPRWKGKDAKAKKDAEFEALKEPMSKIISELQSSLVQSDAYGILSDKSVHFAAGAEHIVLLEKACFGRPVGTVEKEKVWFQLSLEEAFFLCYSLNCLKINGGNRIPQTIEELWHYMKSKKVTFPNFFKAYAHLRMKNWVVRSGFQYGVDFVVYRHHPSCVHSEYGVLVLSDGEAVKDVNGRLRVWSDVHCATRLVGSVAKTLLVLYISRNGSRDDSPSCLANYTVEERTITRWSPEQCRESCG
ncbi:hypothetical protein PIB30_008709 [Stylosanthes scabra]|uniref:tRNA-intron lyase n=1 Tax=Stylosanthes scabra TaxID=79078 RepID=A0ABU6U3W2_9FABA|nr:hypothetical protein [Stylosanthes scabra]